MHREGGRTVRAGKETDTSECLMKYWREELVHKADAIFSAAKHKKIILVAEDDFKAVAGLVVAQVRSCTDPRLPTLLGYHQWSMQRQGRRLTKLYGSHLIGMTRAGLRVMKTALKESEDDFGLDTFCRDMINEGQMKLARTSLGAQVNHAFKFRR